MGDHEALGELVHKATSKRQAHLEPAHLSSIKALCRASDSNVEAAFGFLYQRLKQPHSQARLLALEVCDELFTRSKVFRGLLAAKLTHVLELVVGHKPDNPLPQPPAVAAALRSRALEVLERWHAQFGGKYKQVALGYGYLKNTLRLPFPDLQAQAERRAAEEQERQAQAQRAVQEAFSRLCDEHEVQAAEFRSFLDQMAECFLVLAEQQQDQQEQRQQQDDEEGLDWEDVGDAIAAPAVQLPPSDDALPGYTLEPAGPAGAAQQERVQGAEPGPVTAATASIAAAAAAGDSEALLETLGDVYKLVVNRALPAVHEWLRVLAQVDPGAAGSPQHAQHGRLLAASTEMQGQLEEAKEKYEELAQQLRLVGTQQAAAGAAVALDDLFGPESDTDEGPAQAELQQPRAVPQEQQQEQWQQQAEDQQAQPQADTATAAGNAQADGVSQASETPGEGGNPYETFQDPAAPKRRLGASGGGGKTLAVMGAVGGREQRSDGPPQRRATAAAGGLPENLKKALAEKAPVLPGGLYTHYWDSSAAPVYVSGHGLEVSNHWGAVDVHAELPPERVEELFMHAYSLPTTQPEGKQRDQRQRPSGGRRAASGGGGVGQGSAGAGPSGSSGGVAVAGAGAGYASTASEGTSTRRAERAGAAATTAGGGGLLGVFGEQEEDRGAKRARRAAERAFNEAVLGGAMADEELARRLHETELAKLVAQQAQQEEGAGGKKRSQKPKLSVRERLEKKLLRGRGAAERDAAAVEAERQREKFGNRWENK